MMSNDICDFVAKQRELLDLELQAENDESKPQQNNNPKKPDDKQEGERRRSHILGRLEASEVSVGLYGRTVVRLSLWSSQEKIDTNTSNNDEKVGSTTKLSSNGLSLLPAHKFTVGNEVEIHTKGSGGKDKKTVGGVISAISDTFVSVALSSSSNSSSPSKQQQNKGSGNNNNNNKSKKNDTVDDNENDETDILDCVPLQLVPKSSIVVNKKLVAALTRLERHGADHPIAGSVIRTMFPSFSTALKDTSKIQQQNQPKPFNPSLDESQRNAIAFALHPERKVALIHGPPGTGKTTTIAELIRQAVYHHNMRVLVTAPSNVAVDNILERLMEELPEEKDDILIDPITTSASANSGDTNYNKHNNKSTNPNSRRRPALRTVRLGHPARIKPSILSHSLEALVQSSDGTEIVKDVRKELESYLKIMSRGGSHDSKSSSSSSRRQGQDKDKGRHKKSGLDRRAAYREIKSLRKEVRVREEKVVQELIMSAQVVLATTVGADNRVLNQITHPRDGKNNNTTHGFDLVIIDEAAQALEASCWIPILRGKKVVLAGDHCQLPPTIKSKDQRAVMGLSVTLFERLMNLYKGQEISRMLQIQYRMHHKIADWASQAMYNGELLTHDSVRNRTLRQLDSVRNQQQQQKEDPTTGTTEVSSKRIVEDNDDIDDFDHLIDTTLLLIDTAGCDMHEKETAAGSRYNEGEANLVCEHVRKLIKLGVEQNQVAIITPYNGQVELLRNMLLPEFPKLEIRSVDGFQGGEREAVVLSLVRSSERGGKDGIGFLRDDRRQNVAVTRAKRHMALICDSETVSKSSFIENLISWIEDHGEHRSAIEYTSIGAGTNKEHEEDLRATELEIMKLVESSCNASPNINGNTNKCLPNGRKDSSTEHYTKTLEESKRKALMDTITEFLEKGANGEEMMLSPKLSSYDRRLIHEFAEQIGGLSHRSEGAESVDRRIVLTIQKQPPTSTNQHAAGIVETAVAPKNEINEEEENTMDNPQFISNFSALSFDDSDSDGPDEGGEPPTTTPVMAEQKEITNEPSANLPAVNSLLGQLAKERASRQKELKQQQQQQQQQQQSRATATTTSKKKKQKKSKGKKLDGKPLTTTPSSPKETGENLDDLDDMAFLDTQIEKSQNSHGRKVEGKGKNYRTIVNGILNTRTEPQIKSKRNSKTSSALNDKLKEAGNSRKKKNKKK
jgi:ATP-dependent RNA/DNA helicase IGHMBP2